MNQGPHTTDPGMFWFLVGLCAFVGAWMKIWEFVAGLLP